MTEGFGTTKILPLGGDSSTAAAILQHVYQALAQKGYDPVAQLVGYLMTGDPTYITSHGNARNLICRLERDEVLEEFVRQYFSVPAPEMD